MNTTARINQLVINYLSYCNNQSPVYSDSHLFARAAIQHIEQVYRVPDAYDRFWNTVESTYCGL